MQQCILAMTAAIWHHNRTAQPVKRQRRSDLAARTRRRQVRGGLINEYERAL